MPSMKGYTPAWDGPRFRDRFPERNHIKGQQGRYFVPCWQLRDALVPLIEREGKYLCEDGDYTNWGDNGKYTLIAERVSSITKVKPASIYRKLYDICVNENQPRDNIGAEFAEACFIACGERMEDYPIIVLPSNYENALEMAHVWADSPDQVKDLAHSLLRFAIGYVTADEIMDPEAKEKIVAKRNVHKRRKAEAKRRQHEANKRAKSAALVLS